MSEPPPYRLPRSVVPDHYSLVFAPDLAGASFDGEATIDIRVREATAEVVLNAAELDIVDARLEREPGQSLAATVSYRAEEEQAVLHLASPAQAGRWKLKLRFSGKLNDLLRGFYRSKWRAPDGTEAWIATTQFEPTDARRAFPCWDEPDLKATFAITVIADEDQTVLSNARELSSETLGNGKRRVSFANTIKMSTYLVAMVVGPFELTSPRDLDGVPMRIASVPGRESLRGLAEDAATHALSFLRDYFAMPYPADKLDHVAIPDFASGAMENLGLVTYRETALLVDPEHSSQAERQRVVSVIAHETAHMWFGDLVTMRWWEGIWLNEAFASFMELLVTDAFNPRWQCWTTFGVDRSSALATDSLSNTRAIEYPVGRPEEAEDMFDEITYDKGCSVLRMIERHLGEESFRRGINLYLDRHRHANTDTTDLWDALELASGEPVRATMGTWVSQPGHPVISAELSANRTSLYLSQRRFLLQGEPDDRRWVVPISLRYATANGEIEHRQLLLSSRSTTVALKGEPAWLLVNEGAWGVYRVHYSDGLRRRLFGALGELDARERLGLVADVWAETVAGTVPLEGSLRLWSLLEDERDPDVWWAVAGGLGLLELVARDDDLQALQRLVRRLAGMAFAEIGWSPGLSGTAGAATGGGERTDGAAGSGEEPRLARLRARLVTLLGTVGCDREVRAQARQRLADADAGRSPLPPDLATAVAQVVAAGGADDEWELLYSHYRKAATPQDEVRYLHALGGFSQPHLVSRSLELALSDEVRTQDAPYLVASILGRRDGCALAWEFIEEHWDEMQTRWPPNSFHRVLESLPALVAAYAPARAGGARAPAGGTVPPGGAALISVAGGPAPGGGMAGAGVAGAGVAGAGVAGGGVADQALAWLGTHPLARGGRKVAQARERLEINIAFRRRVAGQLTTALSRGA